MTDERPFRHVCTIEEAAALESQRDRSGVQAGDFVEATDVKLCGDCLACVNACQSGARLFQGRRLKVAHDLCCGCGLCVMACPSCAIRMVERKAAV